MSHSKFDIEVLVQNAILVESTELLSEFLNLVSADNTDVFAVDTESAGFYKYKAITNLIQVSTRSRAALLDPQKIKEFEPLRAFARQADCEWIFHGSDYDVRVLARDVGVEIPRIFDTRLAAELLGFKELGLSALSEKILGVPLDKRLQRCDWSRRPLTPAMRTYGILDAITLIPVRDYLRAELKKLGRLSWAEEEFGYLANLRCDNEIDKADPCAYMIKGSSRMPTRSLAVLREVWLLREGISARLDRAPFMVLSNLALLEIARQAPRTLAGLSVINHIGSDFLARFGKEVKEAIQRGLEADLDNLQTRANPRRQQHIHLSAWEGELSRKLRDHRNEVSNAIKIPASLIASGEAIDHIAKERPQEASGLSGKGLLHKWQADLLAEGFLALLCQEAPAPGKKKRKRRRAPAIPIT
ncbi:MAG: HRDC domain-containing protein [Candidatus Riflebacteria bacterium]|nr:HRDC domain-containing protein [Candidatus Riflebacteria bacterium]